MNGASPRVTLAVVLVGVSSAWNGGNVGPVVSEIADEFDVSLAVVGILAGTLFLGSCLVGLLFAAQLGQRVGLERGLRMECAVLVVGNLLFAVTPVFAGLAIGRILPGIAFAVANTLGVVWAQKAGGVRLVGIFGAAVQLGIALALLVGSGLADLGVDWRVGFLISAALGVAAYLAIPGGTRSEHTAAPRSEGFLNAAWRHARVYRLALLFVSIYGVPMMLSAWLIEFLAREGDVSTSLAGLVAFLLFGLSAGVRVFGAQLKQRGVPHWVLGGALALAAIGMALLAFEPAEAAAFAAVVLIASGFGIPYATALTEAQNLYPPAPGEPVALMTFAALVPPIVAIPVIGHALAGGEGPLAFGILAGFLLLASLANLKRTGIPLTPAGAEDV
jgi:predicted MFS family arabinose efflux permease